MFRNERLGPQRASLLPLPTRCSARWPGKPPPAPIRRSLPHSFALLAIDARLPGERPPERLPILTRRRY